MYFPSLLARKVKLNLGVDTDFPLCCSFGIRFYGIGEPSREIDGRVPGGQYGMITKGHVHIPCACPIFFGAAFLLTFFFAVLQFHPAGLPQPVFVDGSSMIE